MVSIRNTLQEAAICGTFSFDDNLHLTLVFLGECSDFQLQAGLSVMKDTLFGAFRLTSDKVGCFKRDGGDTWWIGIKEHPSLIDLQADLSQRFQQKGFILERRKYVPHVTIGRQVKLRSGFIRPQIGPVDFAVTSIELMKSERLHGKLVYSPLCSIDAKNNFLY